MNHAPTEMKFLATPEKGEVSALLIRPRDASHLLVLGHGASTNMRHATLQAIADRMADAGIATFRYNFPYIGARQGPRCPGGLHGDRPLGGRGGARAAPDLPLLAGGHSFGGRMTSTAASRIAARGCPGTRFLRLPAASARQARHEAGRPPRCRHGPDALPQRHPRRTGRDRSPATRMQEARQSRDAPSPGHGRPRIPHPQTLPQERGGCLRRDGPRRPRLGIPVVRR